MNTRLSILVILLCNFRISPAHERMHISYHINSDADKTAVNFNIIHSSKSALMVARSNVTKKSGDLKNLQANDSLYGNVSAKNSIYILQSELSNHLATIELLKQQYQLTMANRNRGLSLAVIFVLIAAFFLALQYKRIQKNKLFFQTMTKLSQRQQMLLHEELKMAKLKEQELLCEIEYKAKSLTTYALSMVQKNKMLEEVKESVELLLKKPNQNSEHFKKLSRIIEFGFALDKDWDDFKMYFQEVQTDFFPKLKEKFPELSTSDLKLCALIKLNLNMKQTAAILRISPDSVKVARHRLRKKFGLSCEENLTAFVMSLYNVDKTS
jgi:hypothetical protein